MSDRPDAWGPRRSAWRIERLEPSLDRLPERREPFVTLGDLPVEGLYGPWDLERDGAGVASTPADPLFAFTRRHACCRFSLVSAATSSDPDPVPSASYRGPRASSLDASRAASPHTAPSRPDRSGI